MSQIHCLDSKQVKGRYIRHSPPQATEAINKQSHIFIKSGTPYVSALKRIQKAIKRFDSSPLSKKRNLGNNRNTKYISVKAMGRATPKALSLGLKFQYDHGYEIKVKTGSVEVIDEFKLNNSMNDDILKSKNINEELIYRLNEDGENEYDEYDESLFSKRMVGFIDVHIMLKRNFLPKT